MVYISPDGSECVIHCSCGDNGDGDPHILLRYNPDTVWTGGEKGPPELNLFADDGHYEPTLWNRVKAAWRILLGDWPQWPGMMLMLGGNERDSEVASVRGLAAWLNEKADRYERGLDAWETEWRERRLT